MRVEQKIISQTRLELDFSIERELFEVEIEKVYKETATRYIVPGYRKGSIAPRFVYEKKYGKQIFEADAFNKLMNEQAFKYINENGIQFIELVESPSSNLDGYDEITFSIVIDVKPDLTIENYKGIEVKKIEYIPLEEEINNQIKKVLNDNIVYLKVYDRPLQENDLIRIDYEGRIDGELFDENTSIYVDGLLNGDNGNFVSEFEKKMWGMNIEETRDIIMRFPENCSIELKDKDIVFTVKLNEINIKKEPILDDEFVKDISEYGTVEEYLENTRKVIEQMREDRAKTDLCNKVLDVIIKENNIPVADTLLERHYTQKYNEFTNHLKSIDGTVEAFATQMGKTVEDVERDLRIEAYTVLARSTVLENLIKQEDITITEEEFTTFVEDYAKNANLGNVEKFKKEMSEPLTKRFETMIKCKKVIERLLELSNIVD